EGGQAQQRGRQQGDAGHQQQHLQWQADVFATDVADGHVRQARHWRGRLLRGGRGGRRGLGGGPGRGQQQRGRQHGQCQQAKQGGGPAGHGFFPKCCASTCAKGEVDAAASGSGASRVCRV